MSRLLRIAATISLGVLAAAVPACT